LHISEIAVFFYIVCFENQWLYNGTGSNNTRHTLSFMQYSRCEEPKHYKGRCSAKRPRKEGKSCGELKCPTGEVRVPAAEECIPIEKNNNPSC
jgi:hypothetical protein